jgi:two-component system, NarL family, sensor histidine kinase LiaS
MRYYILLLLFTSFFSYSQDWQIDSLKRELRKKIIFKNDTSVVLIYERLAEDFLNINTDSSVKYATNAIDFAHRIKFDTDMDKCYLLLGIATAMKGADEQALAIYFKSLSYAEKHKKVKYIGLINRFTGDSYISIKHFDKALEHYSIAKNNFEIVKDSFNLAKIYNSIGNAYINKQEYKQAYSFYLKSKELFSHLHNKSEVIFTESNIGNVLLYLGKEQQGMSLIEKTITNLDENRVYQKVNMYYNIVYYFNKVKQYEKSNLWAKKGLALALQNNYKNEIYLLSEMLYNNYSSLKIQGESLKYLEISQQAFKENIEKTQKERLNLVNLEYEFDKLNENKKQQEEEFDSNRNQFLLVIIIVLLLSLILALFYYLRLKTKNIEIGNALLKGQTSERKRVAVELHDNLGSQISAMRWGMMALNRSQLSKNEQEIYDNVLAMMNNSYDEVRNLSHNLMPIELEQNGLVSTFSKFIDKLNKNEQINFKVEFINFEERIAPKLEFEIYTILLEFINNIIKHSKASEANLVFQKDENTIIIKLSDNGIGLTNNFQNEGSGFQNVSKRINDLGGKLKVKNANGLNILFEIPIR